jgi:Protein of unknown function (DUF2934)
MSSNEKIAELAYQLWTERGQPHGSHEQDWLEAEQRLSAAYIGEKGPKDRQIDTSLKETFPASDPPASHLPDVPPSNAADKWIAAGKNPPSDKNPGKGAGKRGGGANQSGQGK